MNLRYCLMSAHIDCHEPRHPQLVMKELGITYQHSTPQSMGDQWWFWNCQNVPAKLPEYLKSLTVKPLEMVGYGLSQEDAENIVKGERDALAPIRVL